MLRLSAATKKGGVASTFPDVCKTPAAPSPIPLPYPNVAQLDITDETCPHVLIEKKETVVESSVIKQSSGDEPGTLKGVVSNTHMGECRFKTASSKVFAGGKRVVFHTAVTSHNGSNPNMPVGCHHTASQSKVLVAP